MDLNLQNIVLSEKGEILTDEMGDKLYKLIDSTGEVVMMYLSNEEMRKLIRKLGEAISSDSEMYVEEIEENKGPSTSGRMTWPMEVFLFLLDLYVDMQVDVGPIKKFRNKNETWGKITMKLKMDFNFSCTTDQCESHLKSIKRAHGNAEKKRMTSRSEHVDSSYAEGIARLKATNDNLQPEILVGIGQ